MIAPGWISRHALAILFSIVGLGLAAAIEIRLYHSADATCPQGLNDCGAVVVYFLLGPAEGIVVLVASIGAVLDRIRGRRAGWAPTRVRRFPPPPRPDMRPS
jgi:hypothetical protein